MNQFIIDTIPDQSGSTAVVCLLTPNNKLYVANIGDARAVLSRDGQAFRLSVDHKPHNIDEERRIRSLGGMVSSEGRVNGCLAVSRAFGDLEMVPYVSCVPFVRTWELNEHDEFLILACDGVWDVISDSMAVDICQEAVDPSTKLRDFAYMYESNDNISVIVVDFRSPKSTTSVASEKSHSSSSSGQHHRPHRRN
eukprot:TRINITY_DN5870_c0_g1_i1.p1 TRINITY_DN5870_c0_g1~~TRINITY_DN5870_c0_g1_i1.p1  ORF type:complete len:195 (-),score=35.77 TRINITY_DN5870_c0_g1_i1:36-620(-)